MADVVRRHLLAQELLGNRTVLDALAQQAEEEAFLARIRLGLVVLRSSQAQEVAADKAQPGFGLDETKALARRHEVDGQARLPWLSLPLGVVQQSGLLV